VSFRRAVNRPLTVATIYCPCCTRLPRNRGSVGSRQEGLTLAADRRQPFGWSMTRNNARIIAKYLREAGWSEVTALRQELAASKARVQEMGRHNATEAEQFRAICRRIEDWVSIMTTLPGTPVSQVGPNSMTLEPKSEGRRPSRSAGHRPF
jgi:hypothetical protein